MLAFFDLRTQRRTQPGEHEACSQGHHSGYIAQAVQGSLTSCQQEVDVLQRLSPAASASIHISVGHQQTKSNCTCWQTFETTGRP